jgi:4-hydroxybenzoate polyprenyltransferase
MPRISYSGLQRFDAHVQIMRLDHSIKQIFILPGVILALSFTGPRLDSHLLVSVFAGLLAATLIASSNYVLNEMLDARTDRFHPTKKNRPAAVGLVSFGWGYAQWIFLLLAGIAVGWTVSRPFVLSSFALWAMGCIYNIPPLRSKDIPYVDVISESINNPIRFCLGWYSVTAVLLPPTSLLLSYWLLGCYFMGLKRFAEYKQMPDASTAASYRASFAGYTAESLLNSVTFYGSASMLFLGAFIVRYRIELILAFPFVAWVMSIYFGLSFQSESAVQNPEKLYREPRLMTALLVCVIVTSCLLYINIPSLGGMFPRTPMIEAGQAVPALGGKR